MLQIENLYSGYEKDQWVIKNISINLDYGDTLAVLGRNGSGKSTFAKTLMGTVPLCTGKLILDGTDITNLNTSKRIMAGMAWLMQDENIFPQLTVEENLILSSGHLEHAQRDEKIGLLSSHMELIQHPKRKFVKANYLSKGESQQLALAIAFLSSPNLKCLILDEPSAGLSQSNLEKFFNLIRFVTSATRLICILVEQNRNLADALCNKKLEI